jgi:hypothetical protein
MAALRPWSLPGSYQRAASSREPVSQQAAVARVLLTAFMSTAGIFFHAWRQYKQYLSFSLVQAGAWRFISDSTP